MADIDFLASKDGDKGESDKKKKGAPPEDLPMHVPEALPEEPKEEAPETEKHGFLDGMKGIFDKKDKEKPVEDIFEQKLEISPKPPKAEKEPKPEKAEPSKVEVPAPPKPSAPAPVAPPPTPKFQQKKSEAPKDDKKDEGETLRVSLITTEEGTSLTELTIRDRIRTFIIVLIVAVAMDGLIFGGILYYKSRVIQRIQGIEAGVQDLDKAIADAEAKVIPAQNFQRLSKLGHDLLEVHMHWTNVLKLLEERTSTEVQFRNLSGADTGTLTSNISARDYTTLARQIVALREDDRVLDASITTATADFAQEAEGESLNRLRGVSAGLTIVIDPKIFMLQETQSN